MESDCLRDLFFFYASHLYCIDGADFAIVKFPQEEDTVAVVPRIWLRENYCLWPPGNDKSIRKLIEKSAEPSDLWSKVDFVVIGWFGK